MTRLDVLLRAMANIARLSLLAQSQTAPEFIRAAMARPVRVAVERFAHVARQGPPYPICASDLLIYPDAREAYAAAYTDLVNRFRPPGESAHVDVSRETSSPDH